MLHIKIKKKILITSSKDRVKKLISEQYLLSNPSHLRLKQQNVQRKHSVFSQTLIRPLNEFQNVSARLLKCPTNTACGLSFTQWTTQCIRGVNGLIKSFDKICLTEFWPDSFGIPYPGPTRRRKNTFIIVRCL